jgi:RNase P subunit RPR2
MSEAVARHNGILENCMYCGDSFGKEDKWKLEPHWASNYISVTCSSCKGTHRFSDNTIHTKDDLEALVNKVNAKREEKKIHH